MFLVCYFFYNTRDCITCQRRRSCILIKRPYIPDVTLRASICQIMKFVKPKMKTGLLLYYLWQQEHNNVSVFQPVAFVQYLSVYITHNSFLPVDSDEKTQNGVVGTKPWTVTFCLRLCFCVFVFLLRKYSPVCLTSTTEARLVFFGIKTSCRRGKGKGRAGRP